MKKLKIRIITTVIVFIVFILVIILSVIYINDTPEIEIEGLFVIEEGDTAHNIAQELEKEGYIKDSRVFISICKVKGLEKELKKGTYNISSRMTVDKIITTFSEGKVYTRNITIPEGMRLNQITDILAREGIIDRERFKKLLNEPERWERIPEEADNLEGYLFPDTYRFTVDMNEKDVIDVMVERFFQVYDNEIKPVKKDDMSLHQVITLASIIEKEAMLDEERPKISSVFHNRLKKGMKLQSCATVLYGVGKLDERITINDLKDSNPYNTYINQGLPPGPICSPGLKSMLATVKPLKSDYLYFVSKGDGSHHFSTNFIEHENYRINKN